MASYRFRSYPSGRYFSVALVTIFRIMLHFFWIGGEGGELLCSSGNLAPFNLFLKGFPYWSILPPLLPLLPPIPVFWSDCRQPSSFSSSSRSITSPSRYRRRLLTLAAAHRPLAQLRRLFPSKRYFLGHCRVNASNTLGW